MRQRPDVHVIHEPLHDFYYVAEDLKRGKPDARYTVRGFRARYRELLGAYDKPFVFAKNHAYYTRGKLRSGSLTRFTNTFLIRDPERSIPSQYEKNPDMTLEEAGYKALVETFDMVATHAKQSPVVIDGSDLQTDPENTMKMYCAAVGMPFDESSLSWKPVDATTFDERHSNWFDTVANSNGFIETPRRSLANVPREIRDMIETCRPLYDYLMKYKLQSTSPPANSTDTASAPR